MTNKKNDEENNQWAIERSGRRSVSNAIKTYEALAAMAHEEDATVLVEYGYPAQLGEKVLIFRGYAQQDVDNATDLRRSAVQHSMSLLKAMNCLTQILPGNRQNKSVYLLHYKPTLEHFEEFSERSIRLNRKHNPSVYESLVNDIVRLREEVQKLAARVKALEDYPDARFDHRSRR